MSSSSEGKSRPTVTEVARRAGVSRATAARALGGYGSVDPELARRVLSAAERIGYRANRLARSVATGRSHTLGVVVADIQNVFFSSVVRGITDQAGKAGLDVIVSNSDEDPEQERRAVDVLVGRRADGLIVAPVDGRNTAHLSGAVSAGVPVVLLDRSAAGAELDSVVVDNRSAMRAAVGRLAAEGHRRIALVGGPELRRPRTVRELVAGLRAVPSTARERVMGYLAGLRDADLPVRFDLVGFTGQGQRQAAQQTAAMLADAPPPSALVTTDTFATLGALEAIRAAGLDCPADVSLIGFDDTPWARFTQPPLSMITQPVYEMGVAAADALIERMNGREGPGRRTVLGTGYVARDSVAPYGRG